MVNRGEHPNAALRKVAEANRFAPPIVQRMVEAMNTSRTLAHMKHANGPARADSFALADASEILGQMYPEQVLTPAQKVAEALSPDDYGHPEREDFMTIKRDVPLPRMKVAEYAQDRELVAGRVIAKRQGLMKLAEAAKSEYRQSFYKIWEHAKNAALYFDVIGHEPFALVEKKAFSEFGEVGKQAMNLIFSCGNIREKRAELKGDERAVFDTARDPYKTIASLVKAAHEMTRKAEAAVDSELKLERFCKESGFVALKKEAAAVESKLLDSVLVGEPTSPFEKEALDPATLALLGGSNVLGLKEPGSDSVKREALSAVMDPQHEAKMQSIKVRAMLNDFVSNDPILSSYDPAHVADAYNQMAQLSPQVSQQPAVMRGLLRKILQQGGVMEPFEAHQVSDIEKRLRGLGQGSPEPDVLAMK
jgi:hypothetical protein